jgi:hypothetical protein
MNERLKQIMIESGTHKYISAECQHRIEIVAELIVRECMEWCDAHATINGTAQQIRDSIKKDFGVEE